MSAKIAVFITVFAIFSHPLTAFADDYYPLETGNVRYLSATPEIVGEIIEIGGITYYEIYNPERLMHYCRIDENGNVYRKNQGQQEELYYITLNIQKQGELSPFILKVLEGNHIL